MDFIDAPFIKESGGFEIKTAASRLFMNSVDYPATEITAFSSSP
jgi:hypothetical protein